MSADETTLRAVDETWLKTYNAEDAQALTALYADDAILMVPGEPVARGRAAILASLQKQVTGLSGKVVSRGKYVSVLRRVDSQWKIIRDIWNEDPPSPAK